MGLTNAKVVFGYEAADFGLAAKRGEVDITSITAQVGVGEIEKGFLKAFCALQSERSAWHPDLPAITELVDLTPEQENMLSFVEAITGAKSMFGPPNMPADLLEYQRSVFDQIMEHKGYLKIMAKRYPVWEKPIGGEATELETEKLLGMPPEWSASVRNLFEKYID